MKRSTLGPFEHSPHAPTADQRPAFLTVLSLEVVCGDARDLVRAHAAEPGRVVRVIRRALLAVGVAGLIASVLRVRGRGGVPPQRGGWQEVPFTERP